MDILKETHPVTSTAEIHNARMDDDGDVQMDVFWRGELDADSSSESDSSSFASELRDPKQHVETPPERQPCFLDTPAPFDLAILATGISRWDAETGLDADLVKYCLDNASWCLGASLHAKWTASAKTVVVEPSEEAGTC